MVEVGGWFASCCIAKLADKVLTYISDQYQYEQNVRTKLRKLVANLRTIQAAIYKAESAQTDNPSLHDWLTELKEVAYDAEDVLDKFEYRVLQEQAATREEVRRNLTSLAKNARASVKSQVKKLCFQEEHVNELLKIAGRFEDVVDQIGGFLSLLGSERRPQTHSGVMECRQTSSNITEPRVFGRENEIACLVNLLKSDGRRSGSGSEGFSVVSIVGIGAVGKTTLAQCVHNDGRLSRYFNLRVWICVSNNFDVKRITKEIIQSASIKRPHDFHSISNLDKIQEILKKGLKGQRFLIVLDDVWNQTRSKWESLCTPFQSGRRGSRVIVTTRNPKIAQMMGSIETIPLEGLAAEAYWTFFKQCAFRDARPDKYPNLVRIGREIATKLKGSPLAAKTVGAVLRANLDFNHWNNILNSRLYQVEQGDDGILPALRLTYEHLPVHLKQCFVFCSLFPSSHAFERESLVRMWMSQGFIQPEENKNLEDTGRAYFDDLLQTSVFQQENNKNRYVMHDLMHEVAQSVSLDEYCRIEKAGGSKQISERVRHLCVNSNLLPRFYKSICDTKSLRSLVLLGDIILDSSYQDMFVKLKSLRLLVIWGFQGELPGAVGGLIHLRYLDLYQTDPVKLPDSLRWLYHLQGLSVQGGKATLPKGINNLINLRYLNASYKAVLEIAGIGRLTSLQELAEYRVKGANGHEICQLSDMKELRGQLQITYLENVSSTKEATEARLDNKEHLRELKLEWNHPLKRPIPCKDYERVLEVLKPHSKLNGLWISGYGGIRSPSWLNTAWLSTLEEIHLENCEHLEVLPPLGQLESLKVLRLTNLNGLKKIGSDFYGRHTVGSAFPSLEELSFMSMRKWEVWSHDVEGRLLFPRLSKLFITDCPKLRGPLPLPTSRKELVFQTKDQASSYNDETMYEDENIFPPLRLCIGDTSRVAGWLPASTLSSLQWMEIRDFSEDTPFAGEEEWFQHLTSLQQLTISHCDNVRALPDRLTHLPSLERLRITNCTQIQSLPESGLPASLKQLLVHGCHSVLAEQFTKDCLDVLKIAHVSEIRITDSQNKVVYQRHPPSPPWKRPSNAMLLMLLIGFFLVLCCLDRISSLWTHGSFLLRHQSNKTLENQFFDVATIHQCLSIDGSDEVTVDSCY